MYTHFASLCGTPIVRMTLAQAQRCSQPGQMIDEVRATLPHVTFLANDAKIAESLLECGAWTPEELTDPAINRERALWVAACDIAEDPLAYKED